MKPNTLNTNRVNWKVVFTVTAGLVVLGGCGRQPASKPTEPEMTWRQKQAMAHIAVASVVSGKDNPRAIREWKKALAIEPGNRQALSGLAFTLVQANRIEEAVPIYRKLAYERDQLGAQAAKMLDRIRKSKLPGPQGEADRKWLARLQRSTSPKRKAIQPNVTPNATR